MKQRRALSEQLPKDRDVQLVSVKQLARALQVNPWTLRSLVYTKRIPFYRIGNVLRFDLGDVKSRLFNKPTRKPKKYDSVRGRKKSRKQTDATRSIWR